MQHLKNGYLVSACKNESFMQTKRYKKRSNRSAKCMALCIETRHGFPHHTVFANTKAKCPRARTHYTLSAAVGHCHVYTTEKYNLLQLRIFPEQSITKAHNLR